MVERTVDLWQYLPGFLKKFREMDKLLSAEEPEFQALVHGQLEMMNNMFILTATDVGLKKFEKILHLYPNPDDTIESRRNNVMVHWYSKDVYTLKTLFNRLSMLQGNDNIQIDWDEDDIYLLHIITRLELKGQVDTLAQIIEMMLPANIAYESVNRIEFSETFNLFYGVGLVGAGTVFLTDDFNQVFRNPIPHYIGAGLIGTGTLFGTNDFNETVGTDMTLYYASGIVGTGIFFLTDNFNENVNGVLSLKVASGASVSTGVSAKTNIQALLQSEILFEQPIENPPDNNEEPIEIQIPY